MNQIQFRMIGYMLSGFILFAGNLTPVRVEAGCKHMYIRCTCGLGSNQYTYDIYVDEKCEHALWCRYCIPNERSKLGPYGWQSCDRHRCIAEKDAFNLCRSQDDTCGKAENKTHHKCITIEYLNHDKSSRDGIKRDSDSYACSIYYP